MSEVATEDYGEGETTPAEVTGRTPSREDGFELRLDAMNGQLAAYGKTMEIVFAYVVVTDSNVRAISRELRVTKLAAGRRVRHLRREVRTMGNRASDAGVKAAEEKINAYELSELKKREARTYENATHWRRFWAEKGVGIAIGGILFLGASLVSLIVWIYVRGFR